MGLGKLLRVERTVNIYSVSKSKFLGDAVQEINIDHIPLKSLQEIITAHNDDPLLYDGYILNREQIAQLNEFIEKKITPDFKMFEYCLECYGMYES